VLSIINTDLRHGHEARVAGLDADIVGGREVTPGSDGGGFASGSVFRLAPGEARIFVNA
jgi:hypothetical protein